MYSQEQANLAAAAMAASKPLTKMDKALAAGIPLPPDTAPREPDQMGGLDAIAQGGYQGDVNSIGRGGIDFSNYPAYGYRWGYPGWR